MQENKDVAAQAWVTQIKSSWISVGLFEVKMLLENPKTTSIIGAPKYFKELIVFKGNNIPLFDFNTLLGDNSEKSIEDDAIVGLVAYYNIANKKAEYGALKFDSIPENIKVTNEMQIDLNLSDNPLKQFSKTLFQYEEKIIHVLDLNKLFNLK